MAATRDDDGEYVSIFSSTTVIFAASLVGLGFSLVRSKLLAITFGPPGVGEFGLLTAMVGLLANVSLLGTAANLTREVAATGRADGGNAVRRVVGSHILLAGAGLLLALVAAVGLLASGVLDPATFQTVRAAGPVVIVAVVAAVGTILANAILRGLRMVTAQAFAAAGAALLSTILFVSCIFTVPDIPVTTFVAIPFIATAILNWGFLARYARRARPIESLRAGAGRVGPLFLICFPLLLSSVAGDIYNVAVRALVYRETNAFTLGLLQACLALSELYVSFLLAAMAADFMPKISGLVERRLPVTVSVNRQIQMCVILAALLIIPGIVLARYILWIAYGAKFTPAALVLQILLVASLVRTISWPLILTVMAHGQNKTFLVVEVATYACLLVLSFVLQRLFGIVGISIAFNIVYLSYLTVLAIIAATRYGIRLDSKTRYIVAISLGTAYAIVLLSWIDLLAARLIAYACAAGAVGYCLNELRKMGILDHLLDKVRSPFARR